MCACMRVAQQVQAAIQESDIAILVVDARAGLTAADRELADWLRKNYCAATGAERKSRSKNDEEEEPSSASGEAPALAKQVQDVERKVLIAVNKCETLELQQIAAAEFWELGVGDVFPGNISQW